MSQLNHLFGLRNYVLKMKRAAESEGVSQSRWVAKLIEEKLASDWPEERPCSWRAHGLTFPEADELRQQGEDLPRESL